MKNHVESQIQRNCLKWFKLQHSRVVIHAIPNGGKRSRIEASIMQGEGVLAGAADLFIAHASRGKHGLYIEVKTPKGVHRDSQKEFERNVIAAGYCYFVCRSLEDFIRVVNEYVNSEQ